MATYDLIIIGSGPAGEKAALEASRLGAKTAVVEKWIHPGGASVISGTLPSKSLRETVQYLQTLSHPELNGICAKLDKGLTVQDLMHLKNVVTLGRIDCIFSAYRASEIDYYQAKARFTSEREIFCQPEQGEGYYLRGDKFILAVGTHPFQPVDWPLDQKIILDSDGILNLNRLPKKMGVYGGGVIGCEYATIFGKIGVEVTLIDPRGTLLSFLDHAISTELQEIFIHSGICLRLGESSETVTLEGEEAVLTLSSGEILRFDTLLFANGRQGATQGLGLEELGIEVDGRCQLKVNDQFQTNLPHIYAVGDVIGPPALVSVSNREGRLAARHAVTGQPVRRDHGFIPSAVYSIPEIGMIGKTEQELKAEGTPYAQGVCYFSDLAKGLMLGVKEGFLKLLFCPRTHQIFGVHILGPQAAELIHLGQAVMKLGGTLDYFMDEVLNFPTLSAAYKVAALNGVQKGDQICQKL